MLQEVFPESTLRFAVRNGVVQCRIRMAVALSVRPLPDTSHPLGVVGLRSAGPRWDRLYARHELANSRKDGSDLASIHRSERAGPP